MKKLSLAMCFMFSHALLFAQKSFPVQITDGQNNPVPGATVQFNNDFHFITDEQGVLQFDQRRGRYQVKVTSIGYRPFEGLVDLHDSTRIPLQRFNLFLQPVEIRATRAGDKAPFTKTNLTKPEIERLNLGQDLPFLLQQTPSVIVNSDAGNGIGYTGIRIRGTDATRINMTLNGIPYNDAESQGIFFVNLPDFASSVSSIQIQRGVGTSSNGAGAFGATLNLSTNEFNDKAYAEINNTAGSFNTWKNTVRAGSGLMNDHFTVDVRLSRIRSDGFIDRGSSDLRSFYLSGAYFSPKSSLRLNIFSGREKTYQAWNGIPQHKIFFNRDSLLQHYYNNLGVLYHTAADSVNLFTAAPRQYNVFLYPNQTDNYQQDHYQLFFNHSFTQNLQFNSAVFLTKGKGYYEEFRRNAAYASYGLPDFTVGSASLSSTDLVRQLWLDNDFYGGIFSLQYTSAKSQATVGGGINRYDGKHRGHITWAAAGVPDNYKWYDFPADKTDVNLYTKWQQKLSENWQALADLQYRHVGYAITGSRKFPELKVNEQFHFFNPKVGLTFSRNRLNAYVSYAIAHKEPNRNDYETGTVQASPRPEVLRDLEIGVGEKGSAVTWNATIYYMNYKDHLVLVGKVNDVGDPVRVNVDKSYRLGVEGEASVRLVKSLTLSGNLAVSRNRINNFSDNIPRYDAGFNLVQQDTMFYSETTMALSPAVVGSAALQWQPFAHADVTLMSKYVGKQYLDNTSNESRRIDPYFVQDLRLGYKIPRLLDDGISIVFQLNNVFNRKYEANGYTYSYIYDNARVTENFYYPMAGRNFLVALNIRLR